MIILSFLAGMKVLKIFKESSGCFRSFGWYEGSKVFKELSIGFSAFWCFGVCSFLVVCKF